MSDPLNDSEIVCGLRDGDRSAWDALCRQYGRRLYRYIARLIGSDVDSTLDVFQEVMLAAAKGGRRLDADTRLWNWLSSIGHRQASLHWRKHYQRQRSHESVEETATETDDPVELLSRAETRTTVRGVLAEMRAEQVTLLVAKYIDGFSVAEIASEHGGTRESVRSKLARARDEFRKRFEVHSPSEGYPQP